LGQLIDTILHDGRTPLFKIGSEAELSIRKIEAIGESQNNNIFNAIRKSLSLIKGQAMLISNLFRKIEPFGGRKRGRPKTLILENIISDTFSVLSTEIKNLNVEVDLPKTETKVTVAQSEIQQIILNLLENSLFWLKNTPRNNRRIHVSVSRVNVSSVEIIFSDSGPGVDEEYRERIFDPYFSLKQDGVGLGLTISGEIVYSYYSGSLELVENGPLPGATFRVTLNKRV
jgi:C4-dicarboxylate-specific signal transduction histidine kinase